MRINLIVVSLFLLFASACQQNTAEQTNVKTLLVSSRKADCVGAAPTQCMQTREKADAPWTNFFGAIKGFEYQEGYFYEIKIKVTKIDNPPADGSSLAYELVELVKKVKDPAHIELNSTETIDKWFDNIQRGESGYASKQSTVAIGDVTQTLTTYTDDAGAVKYIKAEVAGKPISQFQYYLENGKVVLLREWIMAGPRNVENRFYFHNSNLIQALSKTIPGRMAPEGVPFEAYKSPYGEVDFRLKYNEVQQSANDLLAGR